MDKPLTRQSIPVVLLCGGTGTRMREETEFRPKPMVEVGGHPILWHIMKGYGQYGYKDFIVCLGYRGQSIKEFFLNYHHLSRDIRIDLGKNTIASISQEPADDFYISLVDTGLESLTAERLLRVKHLLQDQPFMLTYGDGVSDIDLDALRTYHEAHKAKNGVLCTITVVHPKSKYGLVMPEEDGRISEFRQYPLMPDYTNGGFMMIEPEFLSYCQPGQMIEDAIIEATKDKKVAMYRHEGFWHSMDTVKDKEDLEKLWKTNPKWKTW